MTDIWGVKANYPDYKDVAAAVVDSFNEHELDLNLSAHRSASMPVRMEELGEPPVVGGLCSMNVAQCRNMLCYIMFNKVQVYDHFSARYRFVSTAAIARSLNRSLASVRISIVRGCHQRNNPGLKKVYVTALEKLKDQGFDLFTNGVERGCQ